MIIPMIIPTFLDALVPLFHWFSPGGPKRLWGPWELVRRPRGHKLPMTGHGNMATHTTYKNGDDWGMVTMIVLTTLLF